MEAWWGDAACLMSFYLTICNSQDVRVGRDLPDLGSLVVSLA